MPKIADNRKVLGGRGSVVLYASGTSAGKYVQVVGYVQQQELGNCFLSFHIVEPAVHPADGFDR